MARKVIQISECYMSAGSGMGGSWNLTALCDDGTMWIIHNVNEDWSQVPTVPQEIVEEKLNNTQQANGAEPTEISADIMEEHMKGCF